MVSFFVVFLLTLPKAFTVFKMVRAGVGLVPLITTVSGDDRALLVMMIFAESAPYLLGLNRNVSFTDDPVEIEKEVGLPLNVVLLELIVLTVTVPTPVFVRVITVSFDCPSRTVPTLIFLLLIVTMGVFTASEHALYTSILPYPQVAFHTVEVYESVRAVLRRLFLTCAAVNVGFMLSINAAAPVTCGHA
jgi:hypothetical protein